MVLILDKHCNPPDFVKLFIRQFWQILKMDYPSRYGWRGQREDRTRPARYSCSTVVGHLIVNREARVQAGLDHQSGTRNDILLGGKKYLCCSILFHNTQLLALIVIKMWENWSSALEEVETVIDSRSKHEFSAKKGLGRVGRSTFLLGADQRLSGEGVFNGIYYCPLGFRAPCTCIPFCMRLVILMFWLRASILSIVNSLDALSHEPAMLRH